MTDPRQASLFPAFFAAGVFCTMLAVSIANKSAEPQQQMASAPVVLEREEYPLTIDELMAAMPLEIRRQVQPGRTPPVPRPKPDEVAMLIERSK
jgi:hypothetical protein